MPAPLADLHCHVLPGVDDGAVDLADAVAMARQAAADGITTVCATPHVRADHPAVVVDELAARVRALDEHLRAEGVAVRIATGAEVAEPSLAALSDEELRSATLGGAGRWLLVEPAPGPLGPALLTAVADLAHRGVRAVVAHPERHVGPDFRERLAELVAAGALVQATAAHVLDDGAGPVLAGLAREGLVQLLGSDAHTARHGRPVAIRAAVERLRAEAGEDVAAFAEAAPFALLAGRDPQPA